MVCNATSFSDQQRPLPCLLNAIYLWGITLSASPVLSAQEPIFLSRSLSQIGIPSQHRDDALQRVQTHILLRNYFMRSGHTYEGKSHSDAAIWFAMRNGFHKPTTTSPNTAPGPGLIDPTDGAAAFWAAYYLDKCWSLLLTLPSACPDQRNSSDEDRIDLPWPIDVDKPTPVSNCFRFIEVLTHLLNVDPRCERTTIHWHCCMLFERPTRQPCRRSLLHCYGMQSHNFVEADLRFRLPVESQYVNFTTYLYLP